MYIWSRVPCSREGELGGPYHWGGPGIRSRTHIYMYYAGILCIEECPNNIYIYTHVYIYIYVYIHIYIYMYNVYR